MKVATCSQGEPHLGHKSLSPPLLPPPPLLGEPWVVNVYLYKGQGDKHWKNHNVFKIDILHPGPQDFLKSCSLQSFPNLVVWAATANISPFAIITLVNHQVGEKRRRQTER